MRCKCCDSPKTMYYLDDFYCSKCRESIAETISEDRMVHEDWYDWDRLVFPKERDKKDDT